MKLGILMKNLGASQLAYYAIKNNNEYIPDLDCILFYENKIRPCLQMNFANMQIYEAYMYDATIVATCLSTAHKMISFPCAINKFFYVWDLEWLRLKEKHFRDLHNIYANNNIKLLARSQAHKNIIEDCWNVKVHDIIDDFNMLQLIRAIENANQ